MSKQGMKVASRKRYSQQYNPRRNCLFQVMKTTAPLNITSEGRRIVRTVIAHVDHDLDTMFCDWMQRKFNNKYEFRLVSNHHAESILEMATHGEIDLFIPLINNFMAINRMDFEEFVRSFRERTSAPIIGYYLYPRDLSFADKMHKLGIDRAFQGQMIQPEFGAFFEAVDEAIDGTLASAPSIVRNTPEACLRDGMEWERVWGSIGHAYESVVEHYHRGLKICDNNPEWLATFNLMLGRAWRRKGDDDVHMANYVGDGDKLYAKYICESNEAYQKAEVHFLEVLKIKPGNRYTNTQLHILYGGMSASGMATPEELWCPYFLRNQSVNPV